MLVVDQRKRIHPHKFTLWVAIGSIIMMFAGLTSAFIVKSNLANWTDIKEPSVFWYSSGVILLSSLTIQMALRSFNVREMRSYRLLIMITALLGIAFVTLQWVGFSELWASGVRFKGSAGAGQFLYVIFGLHALHVLGGVIALLVILGRAYLGKERIYSSITVEMAAIYWHFVDLLWLYIFIFFMLVR